MTDIYMNDADYHRLIDFMLANVFGGMFAHLRDEVMFALGENGGIWPESCRPDGE